ncbi:hypothetical protein [Acinetobacter pollinis]|uniref:hypothetical protein n=1 Tax=Acinetobacter pollinis TaxID=2605270 RepID=UPI0018A269BC|nr:hypothetical protein [Acinetobacter pollinis]MBF7691706.1 hypothetical protein [Acinetobacter pollinis]MBF7699281.1 hypothetical protein [Acinetobacter pollinis]
MSEIVFKDRAEFLQSAFEHVSKIVGDHGAELLECSVPALDTQFCLSHLSVVALAWSYDPTLIDALEQTFKEANQEINDYFGDMK